MISTIVFERKSILKGKHKLRVVEVKMEDIDNTIFYEAQIVEGNEIIFSSRQYKNKYYTIRKAKQFDADMLHYTLRFRKTLREIFKKWCA